MATQGMNLQRRAYLSAEGGVLPCPLMNKVWVLGLVIFGLGNCGDAVVSAPAFGSSVPVTITMRHHTHAVAAGALICSAVCHHTCRWLVARRESAHRPLTARRTHRHAHDVGIADHHPWDFAHRVPKHKGKRLR